MDGMKEGRQERREKNRRNEMNGGANGEEEKGQKREGKRETGDNRLSAHIHRIHTTHACVPFFFFSFSCLSLLIPTMPYAIHGRPACIYLYLSLVCTFCQSHIQNRDAMGMANKKVSNPHTAVPLLTDVVGGVQGCVLISAKVDMGQLDDTPPSRQRCLQQRITIGTIFPIFLWCLGIDNEFSVAFAIFPLSFPFPCSIV